MLTLEELLYSRIGLNRDNLKVRGHTPKKINTRSRSA